MRTLTLRMITEVGPLTRVIEDLTHALENVPEADRKRVRLARALLGGVLETIKPGVCYRRVVWIMLDLSDAQVYLTKLGYTDYATSAGRAAQMVNTLRRSMKNDD